MLVRIPAAIFGLLALVSFLPKAVASPPPEISVLVLENQEQLTITADASFTLRDETGKSMERRGTSLKVVAEKNAFRINGEKFFSDTLSLTNESKKFHIGNRSFHNTLTLHRQSNGTLLVVNTLPLEDYLTGIINSEISSSWPLEAIKAQAVVARTYALGARERAHTASRKRPYDISSTMFDQVYHGAHVDDARAAAGVSATKGQVLSKKGKMMSVYYHSCCGGQTELAENVWPGSGASSSVVDQFCERSPKRTWEYRISVPSFVETLRSNGVDLQGTLDIAVVTLPSSLRVDSLMITDQHGLKMVKATELRKMLGYQHLKSTWFNVGIRGKDVIFAGRGYGHGVGLCQWGAKGMAEAGHSFEDIVKFYYPDTTLMTMY